MPVRVTTVQIQPGEVDEAIRLSHDSVVPAAKQQRGDRSTMLLIDHASCKGMAITTWETEADWKASQASEASGYDQEQLARFAPLLTAATVREVYDLSVSTYACAADALAGSRYRRARFVPVTGGSPARRGDQAVL